MKTVTIDKDRFKQISPDAFISDIDKSTKLYKYIDLLALADIVKNGNFRVKMRKSFNDMHESGELSNFAIERMKTVGQSVTYEDKKRWDGYQELRRLSGYLPTSCFTSEEDELYAMWDSFTTGYTGVRIATTVGDLIECLELKDWDVYIGNISYSPLDVGLPDFERYIFSKNYCYHVEKEVRMYFVPKGLAVYDDDDSAVIKVNGVNLISEVLLSPFIRRDMKGFMITSIKELFPDIKDKIRHSRILEKPRQ